MINQFKPINLRALSALLFLLLIGGCFGRELPVVEATGGTDGVGMSDAPMATGASPSSDFNSVAMGGFDVAAGGSAASIETSGGGGGDVAVGAGGNFPDDLAAGGVAQKAPAAMDEGTGGVLIEASLATLRHVITYFQPRCVGLPCHGRSELGLRDDENLLTNLTTSVSKACGNLRMVEPGKPEESALIKILKGPCGDTFRMPPACIQNEFENSCIPDEYIDALERWILDGAPGD